MSKSEHDPSKSDPKHPDKAIHSDNEKSRMPERHENANRSSPADRPGKETGEGEPPVG
jgi:hypothetical protein